MATPLKKFFLICPLALGTLFIPALLRTGYPTVTVLALALLSFLMLLVDWNKRNLLLYLGIFVSGPIAESIAIYFGAWTYDRSIFLGVPLWLPFVWGNAGLYIVRVKAVIDSFIK